MQSCQILFEQKCWYALPGVIIRMPLPRLRMFSISCVMPAVQCSTVVGDGIAVVGAVAHAVRVAGQVQPVQGEGHGRAQLVPVALRGREALEMNHQDFRKPVQGVSLGTFPPCLAPFACLHEDQ